MKNNIHTFSVDEINVVEREIEDRLARRDETVAAAERMIERSRQANNPPADHFIIDVGPADRP